MREIKFRAWDKDNRGWLIDISQWTVHNLNTSGSLPGDNFAIMQYTGLKDKNGVKIYEGDIIASDTTVVSSHRLGRASPVEYTPSLARFTYYWGHHLSEKGVNRHQIIVIGNIYENSELLEVAA